MASKRQINLGLLGGFLFSFIVVILTLVWSYWSFHGYCDFIGLTFENPCTLPQFIFHYLSMLSTAGFLIALTAAAFISEYAQRSSWIKRIIIILISFFALFYLADIASYIELSLRYNIAIEIADYTKVNFVELLESGIGSGILYLFWRLVLLRHWDKQF